MNRKQEKTDVIYKAALRVFSRYGYRRTRIEDVAGELGMTKGNLYLYVRSKKDLYDGAVASGLRRWLTAVSGAIDGIRDIEEKFRVLCRESYNHLVRDATLRGILIDDPSIFTLSVSEDRFQDINREAMDLLRGVLAEGLNQGRFRKIDPDRVAEALYAIYVMYIIKTNNRSDEGQIREMFEQTMDVVLYGLVKK